MYNTKTGKKHFRTNKYFDQVNAWDSIVQGYEHFITAKVTKTNKRIYPKDMALWSLNNEQLNELLKDVILNF